MNYRKYEKLDRLVTPLIDKEQGEIPRGGSQSHNNHAQVIFLSHIGEWSWPERTQQLEDVTLNLESS